MSVSNAISAHVPYLRRFSRALTGTQAGGDAYVLATLETLVAEPGTLEDTADLRVDLYRLFLKVWESTPINGYVDEAPFSADEKGAQRNLEAIPTEPRIAFLLSALENFNVEEVAHILDCSSEAAAGLIDRAGKEISKQIRTDVLIIEDEPLIAIDIQMLVEELGHRVVAIARTRDEAIAAAKSGPPGLILADIQLADGSSGLDAVNQILSNFELPVIFITAYPERFLTGTPPEPAFLITKPFGIDSLKAVISQALFFDRRSYRKAPPDQKAALV
ncbi:response regulator [Methylovirgula ligni]|uniref:Response regulator receiver domain-containing protein n=1 Tax=Methylovirgula ligni TaxID=569860 RepID=A0A3D9Z2G7_9HYPH|nr:response regulator [Methylovirgula ligni]QAY95319.1 response regulator [Methylovirgula ligni]REF89372.1 response regulator receiver domain-containing protein [Methylovirgula ligni]